MTKRPIYFALFCVAAAAAGCADRPRAGTIDLNAAKEVAAERPGGASPDRRAELGGDAGRGARGASGERK